MRQAVKVKFGGVICHGQRTRQTVKVMSRPVLINHITTRLKIAVVSGESCFVCWLLLTCFAALSGVESVRRQLEPMRQSTGWLHQIVKVRG